MIPDAKGGGNKRTIDLRAVLNGVMYILSTGCQWAALPKDLPPRSTVNDYLRRWDEDRTLDRIHHALYVLCREQAGREASPTAAIIDSQSVKGAEKGGPASIPRATTRARRSKARCGTSCKKRHVLVDTQGLLMQAIIHAADIQDRDGGVLLMGSLFGLYPFLLKLYADGGYQGATFQTGLRTTCRQINIEIVKRSEVRKFVVLLKR
jgi:putative transposase